MAALHPYEQREQRERLPCAGCPSGLSRDRLQHRRRASLCASCHPPALRPLTRRRASPRAAAIRAPVAGPPAGASCAAVSCTRGADAPAAHQRASPSRCARRRRCFSHARAPRSRPPVRHRAPLSAPQPCPRACAARPMLTPPPPARLARRTMATAAAPAGDSASYDFDLFCIGAGSGGVRCSRMSSGFGAKVAVRPAPRTVASALREAHRDPRPALHSPCAPTRAKPSLCRLPLSQVCELPFATKASDTMGGAGGTCVIRGCVPKKLLVCVP